MRLMMKLGVVVTASALAGGCSMFDSDSKSSRNDRKDRDAGMAGYRESGEGRLDWTSPGTGQAIVRDREDNRVILTQWVRQGDRIVVVPEDDAVLLNGQRIYNKNLVKGHEHAIVFQPDGGGPGGVGGPGRWDNNRWDNDRW